MANLYLEFGYRYDDESQYRTGESVEIGPRLSELSSSDLLKVLASVIEARETTIENVDVRQTLNKAKEELLKASSNVAVDETFQKRNEARESFAKYLQEVIGEIDQYKKIHFNAQAKKETPS